MQETQETQVWSLSWEEPMEKEMEPSPVVSPGKFCGQRSLVGYNLWCLNKLNMTEWLSTHIPTSIYESSIFMT